MNVTFYTLSSSEDLDNIRYVGKTECTLKTRLSQHINESKRHLEQNYTHNYKSNWINKELSKGNTIIIQEIEQVVCNSKEEWELIEQYWISMFKIWGFDLTNLTIGGDGVSGLKQSEESNKKRSEALLGTHRPEEIKRKISKSSLGKILSESTKQKISDKIIQLQGRKIKQFDKYSGKFIKEWECVKDAADFYSIDPSGIIKCCKGTHNRTSTAGYIWKYSEDDTPIEIDKSNYIYCIYPDYVIECVNQKEAIEKTKVSKNSIIDCLQKRKEKCKGIIFLRREEFINSNYVNLSILN